VSWLNELAETGLALAYPNVARELRELRLSQWRSAEDLRRRSWRSLRASLRYAYENAPFYRQKLDDAGIRIEDVRSPADLAAVPLTTKAELRDALAERWPLSTSVPLRGLSRASTTGSSGEPFVFPIDPRARDIRLAAVFRNIEWYGHRLGDQNARLWGRAERPAGGLRARLASQLERHVLGRRTEILTHDRSRASASLLDQTALERWAHTLRGGRFKVLDGYVSAEVLLAEHLLATGQRGIGCQAVVSGAESLAPEQRKLLERAFGCPIYNRYGASELGFIAHECGHSPDHQLHVNAELLWLEVVRDGRPAEPGELGEIVITDLTNRAMPLIRYRLNDLGIQADPEERCPCGRGLPLLRSVEGRVDELFYLPNGKVLVSHVWHEIFADQEFLSAFRVTQHRPDLVEVEVVPRYGHVPPERYAALQAWVQAFLPGCTVIWKEVAEIHPEAGGKRRFARSCVSHEAGACLSALDAAAIT